MGCWWQGGFTVGCWRQSAVVKCVDDEAVTMGYWYWSAVTMGCWWQCCHHGVLMLECCHHRVLMTKCCHHGVFMRSVVTIVCPGEPFSGDGACLDEGLVQERQSALLVQTWKGMHLCRMCMCVCVVWGVVCVCQWSCVCARVWVCVCVSVCVCVCVCARVCGHYVCVYLWHRIQESLCLQGTRRFRVKFVASGGKTASQVCSNAAVKLSKLFTVHITTPPHPMLKEAQVSCTLRVLLLIPHILLYFNLLLLATHTLCYFNLLLLI